MCDYYYRFYWICPRIARIPTGSVHQFVDDNAQVDTATAKRDRLYPAGSAHTARAAISGNDVDVGAL